MIPSGLAPRASTTTRASALQARDPVVGQPPAAQLHPVEREGGLEGGVVEDEIVAGEWVGAVGSQLGVGDAGADH